ncbi:lipoprotein [Pseudomonas syringae]|uniref:Lipoprotein n=1 Tax=Pseudomonas syringae TaxID=317 RepID=A0A085V810_PSESX|nr:lipoprotein [Pseudomonas syringae]
MLILAAALLLSACGTQRSQEGPELTPGQIRTQILRLMPAKVPDREGWAADIQAAFTAQDIAPTTQNLCSVLAVAEQESTFQVDPPVPGLGKIARNEIDRRAARLHIPGVLIRTALQIRSPDGKSYAARLDAARTEKQLSAIFDDFIGMVPMGQTLFGNFNPVHTGGPMQVSIAFAEKQAKNYPYPVSGTIRQEVFSRRGGMYFGIAHLLGYPANYPAPLYRFADFNAGWYASRNAAFQSAVSQATGIKLALDGDLIRYDSTSPGSTELAIRALGKRLDMNNSAIFSQLKQGDTLEFEDTQLYERVFSLAEAAAGKSLPRAILPGITLQSPKITRNLTTAWFAQRVDDRRERCMQKVATSVGD